MPDEVTPPMPSPTRAAALTLLSVLAVAGCSASASPAPGLTSPAGTTPAPGAAVTSAAPSASPTRAPTPTPSPTWPPTIALPAPPAEMARDDETGAVAAAEYFLDLYTYTESSQDTGPWEAMSHPDCIFCKSVVQDVADLRAAEQVFRPARFVIHSTTVKELTPFAFSVAVDVSTGPDQLWSAEGQLLDPGASSGGVMTLVTYRRGSDWLIRGVELEERS